MNDLILRSIRGEKIERFPVWLMRQAGRYMPQYRELREKERDFVSFYKNVDLSVKASLLPLELLEVDALIIFSDILVPLEPMGVEVRFEEGEGPKLYWDGNFKSLKRISYEDTSFVLEIIRGVKASQSEVPVIGFCGGPFTLLSYMLDGSPHKGLRNTKLCLWSGECKQALGLLVENLVEYVKGQILAGVDLIQVFDSWVLHLSYEDFEDYANVYLKDFIKSIKEFNVPVIYFFRGSGSFLKALKDLPADCISVDWTVDIVESMKVYSHAFQGNLDPYVLYADLETIRRKTLDLLRCIPRKTRYVFNLGHGLMPDMELEKVKYLVQVVKSYRIA